MRPGSRHPKQMVMVGILVAMAVCACVSPQVEESRHTIHVIPSNGYEAWARCEMRLENLCLLYGEVHKRGLYKIPADGSVLGVIRESGGWTELAYTKRVKILRDGRSISSTYDESRGVFSEPVLAGDMVVVDNVPLMPPPEHEWLPKPERWERARQIYAEMERTNEVRAVESWVK